MYEDLLGPRKKPLKKKEIEERLELEKDVEGNVPDDKQPQGMKPQPDEDPWDDIEDDIDDLDLEEIDDCDGICDKCCDDCDEDDDCIDPSQDIGCLKNDIGRNCEGDCNICSMWDCMYQYLEELK